MLSQGYLPRKNDRDMKRVEFQPIGALLQEYVDEVKLTEAFRKIEIYQAWENAVGEKISNCTINLFYNRGILYCTLSSSMLRNRLYFNLDGIKLKINQLLGYGAVEKIVLK